MGRLAFLCLLVCLLVVAVYGYDSYSGNSNYPVYRRRGGHVRRHIASAGLRGEEGHNPTPAPSDCPAQCRCIALSHLGYRNMAERWMSLGQMGGQVNTFKGTESPVWQQDQAELQGRDVVCMGMDKIPRPLPQDVVKLTMYGDNSNREGGTQIAYLRETSFVSAEGIEQLTISGNNLQILYPFIFRKMPNLQHLALQNNNITHISAATFSGVDDLIELRLSDNILRYLSPNVFSHLHNLEFLFLNGNKLSMIHSLVLRSLKKLKHLDLSRNNFRTFSDHAFDGVINLEELLLNENQIWFVHSRWFRNLAKLRKLEIRANVISKVDASSFRTLFNLEELSLSANAINTVADNSFTDLTNLKTLDLGTNDISHLGQDCFAGLGSIHTLDLSVNRLSFINNKTFMATPILESLDLSKNSISNIEEAALHPLSKLEKLDVSNNKLKKIESKTFTGLLELRNVNLENNIISEVENDAFNIAPLNQLSKITWLSLQFNRLKALHAYSLYGLPHLKFLNLGSNKIKRVHQKSFYTLSSLQNLLLHDNKINSFDDSTFVNLKNLFSLTLENNKISVVNDNTFLGLRNVEDLNLVSNGLEVITPNAFRHFLKLGTLSLKSNLLSTFDFNSLVNVRKVTLVDLSNNQLYDVQFPKQKTHDIRQMILSNNHLQTISADITNVLAPSGHVWLKENPWSCDCRLDWVPEYVSKYRLRLLGSRDTVCNAPAALVGKKLTVVEESNFRCDNTTVEKTLTCQNLQIRYTADGQADAMRKGKKEARTWHVTFKANDNVDNTSRACYGMLLNKNWVLTRQSCSKAYLPDDNEKVTVKVGRRQSRDIILKVDYVTESEAADYDLRLVRLSESSKTSDEKIPCILTHAQYHQLSRALAEGVITTRFYKPKSNKWRLLAKRGKILPKCKYNGDICVRTSKSPDNTNLQGSPLSLRYQGVWYLAGLGITANTTDADVQRFTPLWSASNWIATTIHEVDTKCHIQTNKAVCDGLQINGLVKSADVESFH